MKISGIVLLVLLLCSCITGDGVRSLQTGMPRAAVIEAIGRPDGAQVSGNLEVLTYADRFISGWSPNKTDYTIVLRDGLLESYSTGSIRPGYDSGALALAGAAMLNASQPTATAPMRQTCLKTGEYVSGMSRICNYSCTGQLFVQTISAASLCPLSVDR